MTPSRKRLISGLFLLRRGFLNGPRKTLMKNVFILPFVQLVFPQQVKKVLVLTRHMLFCFLLLTNNYRLFSIHFCYARDLASFKVVCRVVSSFSSQLVVCNLPLQVKRCRVILSRNCFRQNSFQLRHYWRN